MKPIGRFTQIIIALVFFLGGSDFSHGSEGLKQTRQGVTFEVSKVADGLEIPWGMTFLTENEIILTQRNGKIFIVEPKTGRITPMKGEIPSVRDQSQGGLLDVAVRHPYTPGDWIYFTYSRTVDGQGATTLARAKRIGSTLKLWQDLLITQSRSRSDVHYGSRIAFDDRNHLFFTIGDRGHRPNGQDRATHAGSVLRLNLDGSVPLDNPFVADRSTLPEIYSYGHRNPQGIVYDRFNKRLWAIEHGPRGGDEINLVLPGRNYGWPEISYGKEYWGPVQVGTGTHKKGMEQPVKVYTPSIAPGSLLLYTGEAFPQWKGNLFAGALKLEHINRLILDPKGQIISEERLLSDLDRRIRALAQSPEGWIYFSTDSGEIYCLKPVKNQ